MRITIDVPEWVYEAPSEELDAGEVTRQGRRNAFWCYGAVLQAVGLVSEVHDELQGQLAAERDKHAQVAKSVQDVHNRRHTCNTLVNPGFRYQAALREALGESPWPVDPRVS